ncbi:MAG: PQQ-dependent sugar dehydrogenase [Bacteroidota bacterium]
MRTFILWLALCFVVTINTPAPVIAQDDQDRFQKIELAGGLNEPMELAVLPDGRVLLVERVGGIKMYSPQTETTELLLTMNVHYGHEDGLLGLTLDPDFVQNSWIYLFYSPADDEPRQRVSRFTFTGTTIDLASEKVLIEIPTQRVECCHSAGSLAFGPNGNLFIAVGDNTNPHNPGYYNSIDEREGRAYWDAQRTAGNSQDLRGKILRITPQPDGSYTIPDDNLFPKDGEEGRPEIYVMGCRNPYRIGIDQKTGAVFWGDVGQNTINNPERGPISYDEFNMATEAGFFGWPYFAGNNGAYADFDFETEEIGPFADPTAPTNDSPNNTGTQTLPPAQPALIWYSYGESEDFAHLKTGGKSPIGGPTYYSDLYPVQYDTSNPAPWIDAYLKADNTLTFPDRSFPSSYDGKLFIAEWMRDWVNMVTFDENGALSEIAPFLPNETFSHPIELEFGPDGALYMLEYGPFWFAQHPEAKLVRIDYVRGNRPPVARIEASQTVGAAPLTAQFSASASYDLDETDTLSYSWRLGPSATSTKMDAAYTFEQPGVYTVTLAVTDGEGVTASVDQTIKVGNSMPEISLEVAGNQSFYWPDRSIAYQVHVKDLEDGSLNAGIAPEDVVVTIGATDMAPDVTMLAQDHTNAVNAYIPSGLKLINDNGCKACHAIAAASVGPSYTEIADKYEDGDSEVVEMLVGKVIEGGSGTWGDRIMSAHPQLSREAATDMVQYVLSLSEPPPTAERMPTTGNLKPKSTDELVFNVTYRDRGGDTIPSLTAQSQFLLRSARMKAVRSDTYHQASKFNSEVVRFLASGGYITFEDVDLTNITGITTFLSLFKATATLEARSGGIDGDLLGSVRLDPTYTERAVGATVGGANATAFTMSFEEKVTGRHDIYLVFKVNEGEHYASSTAIMEWVQFDR